MKPADQYPVTTPWGYSAQYPLNGGRHRGEDRAMPSGTPVYVNGALIAYSDNTGYSTGSHLHIGRWVNGVDTNPNGGGLSLPGPLTITQVAYDTLNGNYVALNDAQGVRWVYCHLDRATVRVGDSIKNGGSMADPATQIAEIRANYINNIAQLVGVDIKLPEDQKVAAIGREIDRLRGNGDTNYAIAEVRRNFLITIGTALNVDVKGMKSEDEATTAMVSAAKGIKPSDGEVLKAGVYVVK